MNVFDSLRALIRTKPVPFEYPINPPVSTHPSLTDALASLTIPQENEMSFLTAVEHDINVVGEFVKDVATEVEKVIAVGKTLEPATAQAILATVQAAQNFASAATPAIAGEGINFAADTVAYTSFITLVATLKKTYGVIVGDVKTIESAVKPSSPPTPTA